MLVASIGLFVGLDQQVRLYHLHFATCEPSHFPERVRVVSGSPLGIPALRRGPLHLPVAGRHRREASQAHQQQLSTGGVV